jgi:hypothetical protein
MSYITQAELEAVIAPADLAAGLKGTTFAALAAIAAQDVEARISPAVALPLAAPYPQAVVSACRNLFLEMLWARRGVPPEQNPWKGPADAAREQLDRIGAGEETLPGSSAGAGSSPGALFTDLASVMDEG